jgi:lipopolysaccharide transport system ATP-binding protein
MRGRVGALIELGAGFNSVLSGRENIYNNGAILGFTRKEIDEKVQHIIDFAEIEEFIDMPVQNYSSGMKVRLGFAIAAQMEPDVLIIDEVLAVGDLGFVLKCFKTIDTILPNTAIIFVSHSMPMVSRICNQIILMDKGQAKFQGEDISKAIDLYYTRFANNTSNVVYTDHTLELKNIEILDAIQLEGVPQIKWGDDLNIKIEFKLLKEIDNSLKVKLIIVDKEQRPVALMQNFNFDFSSIVKNNVISFTMMHNMVQLSKGIYMLNIVVIKGDLGIVYRANAICEFQVTHALEVWEPFMLEAKIIA